MLLKKCMAPGRPLDPDREVRSVGSVPEWCRCWSWWCGVVVGGGGPGRGVRSGGPGPGGPARGRALARPVRGARPAHGPVRPARSGPGGGGGIDAKPTTKKNLIKQGETLAP